MATLAAPYNAARSNERDADEVESDGEGTNSAQQREEEQLQRMEQAVAGELTEEQLNAPGEEQNDADKEEKKKKKGGPRSTTLIPGRLVQDDKGLPALLNYFKRNHFDVRRHEDKGKNIAAARRNLRALFGGYRTWGQDFMPRLAFEDLLMKAEKLSSKSIVRTSLHGYRLGIADPQVLAQGTNSGFDSSANNVDVPPESLFGGITGRPTSTVNSISSEIYSPSQSQFSDTTPQSTLSPEQTTMSPPLDEELKRRIEEKRQAALRRRQERLSQRLSQTQGFTQND